MFWEIVVLAFLWLCFEVTKGDQPPAWRVPVLGTDPLTIHSFYNSFSSPSVASLPIKLYFPDTMAMNISELEPHIKRILTAPDVDLSSVTARHVRKQLLEEIPSLTPEFLKTNKAEVNTLIAQVFGDVRDEEGEDEKTVEMEDENDRQSRASSTRKRKQESGDEADEGADEKPAKKSKKSKNGQEDTDARLARQLSSEINARVSRRVTTTKKNGVAKKRTKKSSATVESDDEMAGEKPKKKRGRGGLTKEYYLRCV